MAWVSCSQSLVEPSMSVNRKVTVPVGGLGTTVMSSLIPSRGQHYSSGGVPGPFVPKCLEAYPQSFAEHAHPLRTNL